MKFEIIWSEFAEIQLDEIYSYYEKKASARVASKLVKGIIKAPNKLLKGPESGQIEELLKEREIEYRYFVYKNYRLIYSIDKMKGLIKIADVFDTRQNPIKIKRTN